MKLAQAWRDSVIVKHPPMSLMTFCSILRSNNTSGAAGIRRTVKRTYAKNGRVSEIAYWTSRIPMLEGRYRLRYFSVGEEGAKALAVDARMQGLNALEDIAFREKHQPQPVSTVADIALLVASLRAPVERRARQIAERDAKRELHAQTQARKLAMGQAAEQATLGRAAERSAEQYIGRYRTPKGIGYWRVSFDRQGTRHRKCFFDSVCGGTTEALAAAKAWRDRLFCTLPIGSKAAFVTRIKATNTSGMAGVTRKREVRADVALHWWVAYNPQTKGMPRRSKSFSIEKYGDKEAFAMAVSARGIRGRASRHRIFAASCGKANETSPSNRIRSLPTSCAQRQPAARELIIFLHRKATASYKAIAKRQVFDIW